MARTDTTDDTERQPTEGYDGTTTYDGIQTALDDFLNREESAEE